MSHAFWQGTILALDERYPIPTSIRKLLLCMTNMPEYFRIFPNEICFCKYESLGNSVTGFSIGILRKRSWGQSGS